MVVRRGGSRLQLLCYRSPPCWFWMSRQWVLIPSSGQSELPLTSPCTPTSAAFYSHVLPRKLGHYSTSRQVVSALSACPPPAQDMASYDGADLFRSNHHCHHYTLHWGGKAGTPGINNTCTHALSLPLHWWYQLLFLWWFVHSCLPQLCKL